MIGGGTPRSQLPLGFMPLYTNRYTVVSRLALTPPSIRELDLVPPDLTNF